MLAVLVPGAIVLVIRSAGSAGSWRLVASHFDLGVKPAILYALFSNETPSISVSGRCWQTLCFPTESKAS